MNCIGYKEDNEKIAWLTIDLPDREANRINTSFIEDLDEIFSRVEAELRLQGVVFLSGKRSSFISGWDLDELETTRDSEQVRSRSRRMHRLTNRIASLNVPTIAAIHGACLGGGLELAIACHVRIASGHETTIFGLPETRFGLIPGCGGTQRLPRLIGIRRSLDMILSGRELRADQALTAGLIDGVVPVEHLREEARRRILTNRGIRRVKKTFFDRVRGRSRLSQGNIFESARKSIDRESRDNNPALYRAIDVVERGMKEGMDPGLSREARVFGDLAVSRSSRNLLFLERKRRESLTFPGPWPDGSMRKEIRLSGVVGCGRTGAGIVYLLSDHGFRNRFKETSPESVSKAFRKIASLHQGDNRGKESTGKEFERKMDHVSGTTDYSGFGRVDLVIETIPEDITAKKRVYGELEGSIDKSCVIATRLSALSLFDLASDMAVPSRLVGLHFFYPVHTAPFIEIIEGEWTDSSAARTVFDMVKTFGKIPIVVKDTPGFLVNRIRMSCLNESFFLLEEGVGIEAIDRAMVDFGFRLGPFQLIDEIGFEVASKAAMAMKESFGSRLPLSKSLDTILASARKGSHLSFYLDEGGKRVVNPQLYVEIGRSRETSGVPGSLKIQSRLLNAMTNEAVICLEDDVVSRPDDIELGAVLGMGFPLFRGGLLRYADQRGIRGIVEEIESLAVSRGGKRQPADTLVKMAREGRRFFDSMIR